MRRIFNILMIAGSIVLAASCSKKSVETDSASETVVTVFSANLDETVRTQLVKEDGIYKLLWSTGDCITVNGVKSKPISEDYDGKRSARFEVEGTLEPPYNMLYCAKENTDNVVVFPYRQDPDAVGDAPLYASSSTTMFETLNSLYSVVHVVLTGAETQTVQTVALHAVNNEPVSGEFTLGKTDNLFNGQLTAVTGSVSAWTAVSCEEALGAEGKDFYIHVPVGTYANGFEVYVTLTDASQMRVSFLGSGKTLVPNKVYSLPSLAFAAGSDEYVIATEEDLVVLKKHEGNSYTKAVNLVHDLDMTGYPYKTITNGYFPFKGNNHEIKGLTTSLFGEHFAPVTDLTLEADIEYKGVNGDYGAGTDYGVGILAHYLKYSGSTYFVENVTTKGSISLTAPTKSAHAFQIGGLAGASNGVGIKNCVNKASVTVTDGYSVAKSGTDTKYNFLQGGVVGTIQTNANSKVIDCRNEGEVTCNASSIGNMCCVGGVVGCSFQGADITGCSNAGNVSLGCSDLQSASYLGGVVGSNYYDSKSSLVKDCVNEATSTVEYNGTASNNISVGGVCGGDFRVAGSDNNVNYGAVKATDCTATYVFVGGVVQAIDATVSGLKNYGPVSISNVKNTAGTGVSVAGIVAKCNALNITFSDFENNGTITIGEFNSGATAGRYDIGGVIAYHQKEDSAAKTSGATMTYNNLVNKGDIIVNSLSTTNWVRLGGVIGNELHHWSSNTERDAHNVTLTGCRNEGNITVKGSKDMPVALGGIMGDSRVSGTVDFNACSNTGDITLEGNGGANSTGGLAIGGILGREFSNYFTDVEITNCVNDGDIYLKEDQTGSKLPCAGGILGIIATSKTGGNVLNITGSTNNGNIQRTMNVAAGKFTDYNVDYRYNSAAGGIVGSIGYRNSGGISYYVNALISECTNNGIIQFNRKTKLGATSAPCEPNASGDYVFNGGILGQGLVTTGNGITGIEIRSCTNNGKILANFGKNGGIIGLQRAGVKITGTKDKYTVNNGQIMHQGAKVSDSAGTAYGYCGGIVGYLFGDASNSIEYAANYGFFGSNYGGGGIVGQFASSDYPNYGYIKHCKVFCESKATSTAAALFDGGKTALFCCTVSAKSIAAFANVSDVALGGAVYKYRSSKWVRDAMTADNFFKYISATDYSPTKEEAAGKNIFYWNGTDKLSWEE